MNGIFNFGWKIINIQTKYEWCHRCLYRRATVGILHPLVPWQVKSQESQITPLKDAPLLYSSLNKLTMKQRDLTVHCFRADRLPPAPTSHGENKWANSTNTDLPEKTRNCFPSQGVALLHNYDSLKRFWEFWNLKKNGSRDFLLGDKFYVFMTYVSNNNNLTE